MDFVGFTYNGYHSYRDLNIYRTSDGNRYNENITATMTDKTAEIPGEDGQYYFGTTFKSRSFTVNYVFENLSEVGLRKLKQVFSGDGIYDLVFDETPYKAWPAKVTGTASIKYIPFVFDGERVYRGEGSVTFTCYTPYAHTPKKLWSVVGDKWIYENKDGQYLQNYSEQAYPNKQEWAAASGLGWQEPSSKTETTIKGDIAVPVVLELDCSNFTGDSSSYLDTISITTIDQTYSITFAKQQSLKSKKFKWDTKLGLLTIEEGGQKEIIPYTGEGLVKIDPGYMVRCDCTIEGITPKPKAFSRCGISVSFSNDCLFR